MDVALLVGPARSTVCVPHPRKVNVWSVVVLGSTTVAQCEPPSTVKVFAAAASLIVSSPRPVEAL